MALLQLPEELFLQILDLLPISGMYQVAATCRSLHQRVHANDYFWQRKVRQKLNTLVIDADYGFDSSPNTSNLAAIIQVLYSKEACYFSHLIFSRIQLFKEQKNFA